MRGGSGRGGIADGGLGHHRDASSERGAGKGGGRGKPRPPPPRPAFIGEGKGVCALPCFNDSRAGSCVQRRRNGKRKLSDVRTPVSSEAAAGASPVELSSPQPVLHPTSPHSNTRTAHSPPPHQPPMSTKSGEMPPRKEEETGASSSAVVLQPPVSTATPPKHATTLFRARLIPVDTLPPALEHGGNAKAWRVLMHHVTSANAAQPILVHGPVACGKFFGVHTLLETMGASVIVIDASEKLVDVLHTLRTQFAAKTFLTKYAVVIPGINGFQKEIIGAIAHEVELLLSNKRFSSSTPVIATCIDPWDLTVVALRSWKRCVTYTPYENQIARCMAHRHPNTSHTVITRAAKLCRGDLRECERIITIPQCGTSKKDVETNIYKKTNELLRKQTSPSAWVRSAMDQDVSTFGSHPMLLHHNYPNFAVDHGDPSTIADLDRIARIADAISLAETSPRFQLDTLARTVYGTCMRDFKFQFPSRRSTGAENSALGRKDSAMFPRALRDRLSAT